MIEIGTIKELNKYSLTSEKVMEFYEKNWNRKTVLSNKEFYNWQFIKSNFEGFEDTCCIAIDEESNVIGVMGVNSRKFIFNNQELLSAELTTWIVCKKFQNKGVGPKIINYLKNKYDVLLGMGITDDAIAVYLRSGFRYISAIPRFIKVLDWGVVEPYAKYEPLAKKISKYWEGNKDSFPYVESDVTETVIDKIFKNFSINNNLFIRDYESIEWRYINHPEFEYEIKVIHSKKDKGEGAFISLRVEKSDENLKILHIIDIFGDNKDIPSAIEYSIEYAVKNNIGIVDFFSTNSMINSYFLKNGWFSLLDDKYFNFPHLFQPIELRNPATTSLIYWINKDNINNVESFFDISRLYITKEDCDFDRPNI